MILFVNACPRNESRTKVIAERLLSGLDQPFAELYLYEQRFPVANQDFLTRRDSLINRGQFDDPLFDLARQFADADGIVVAAPFWDLSFPAVLKQYFEQINVVGITFAYTPDGVPKGLCRAKKLYYVTTAGGYYVPEEYGFGYVKALAQNYYGIPDVELIMASGLDIEGADEKEILKACMESLP